ncbi:hypothetical protein ACHAWF_011937 [Thalassiosira exigua]
MSSGIRYQSPDVVVAVGSGDDMQEFECYKIALSFASPYFDAMLSSDMAEANSSRIEYPDKDPEEWKLLYKFLDPRRMGDSNSHVINVDVAMKLTPWFHEFQMESFVKKCDDVLYEKVLALSKDLDAEFWDLDCPDSDASDSGRLTQRKENFGGIIKLLQFACQYGLNDTKLGAEAAVQFLDRRSMGASDLFTLNAVTALVQLFLPLEESGEDGGNFTACGKSIIYWELLSERAFEPEILEGLPREVLCNAEIISRLAHLFTLEFVTKRAYNFKSWQLVKVSQERNSMKKDLKKKDMRFAVKAMEMTAFRTSIQAVFNGLTVSTLSDVNAQSMMKYHLNAHRDTLSRHGITLPF